MDITQAELKAFQILFLTIPENKLLGIVIRQLDPAPANMRAFLKEVLCQFELAPAATFKAVGFFDLPKFLNSH